MVCRFFLSADGFVLSKPGANAQDLNLPDVSKLLDSDWFFGGVVIARGRVVIPSGGGIIPFTPMPYVPAADVYGAGKPANWKDGDFEVLTPYGGAQIYNDRIVIPGGMTVVFVVYGLSQQ